jgi:cation transporter-like permease
MPVMLTMAISSISQQRQRDAWRAAGAIVAGALLLCWPAVANRYPILFSDTHAYLVQASQPTMVWDKPWVYGPFLLFWHGRTTLWLAVLGQALLVSHLLWLTRKAIALPTAGFHLALCAVLATGSAAPWFVSLLMPDIFAPVVVLCLFVLGFGASLRPGERRWAGVLGTFAIAAHLSHLVVAAACVGIVVLLVRRWRPVLAAGAPLLGAVVILLAGNLAGNGRFGISPYGSVFALARLVADGPARLVIERDCPRAGWRLCAWVGRLPSESDAFLWDGDGPVWTTPGGPKALAPEASAIVARTLREEPGAVLRAALANTWTQLRLVELGDTLGTNWLEESVVGSLRAYFPPSEEARFRAGMQARGTLPALAAPLNPPFAALLLAGAAASVVLLAVAWRARDVPRAGLAALVLAAVLVNAAAGGVLSRPNARYQARIAWLVLLPALMMGKTGGNPPAFRSAPAAPPLPASCGSASRTRAAVSR